MIESHGSTTSLILCNFLTAGRSCAFYLESHGINSVPTFSSAKQLNNSNSEVKHDSKNFGVSSDELDSADIWCHPRRIYYITKFAKERLIFENSCLEIMTMVPVRNQTTGSIQRFLKVVPFLIHCEYFSLYVQAKLISHEQIWFSIGLCAN